MATRTSQSVEGWSQNKQRSPAIFYDQHKDSTYAFPVGHPRAGEQPFLNGRPWWGYVERPADGASMPMPTGPLTPMGWEAPWHPDEKYITKSIGRVRSDGTLNMGIGLFEQRFRIDYQAMIADYTTAMREYYRKAVLEAAALNQPAPEYGGPIGYQIRMRIGDPPRSPKVPEAALAGDKWLLGQLPPTFDRTTNKWTVVANEQLVRLLHSGDINLQTAEQSIAKQNTVADLQRQLDEFKTLLAAMNVQPSVPAPKTTGPKPIGAYQAFVQQHKDKPMKEIGKLWREQKQLQTAG